MAWTLVFWRNRSTSTVVQAASASQARSRAQHRHKKAMGSSWPHVAMVPAPSSAAAAIGLRHGDTAAATAPGCSSQLQAPAVGPGCRPAARAIVTTRAIHQQSGHCGWRSERSGRSFPWLLQGYRLHASQSAVSRTEPSEINRPKEQSNCSQTGYVGCNRKNVANVLPKSPEFWRLNGSPEHSPAAAVTASATPRPTLQIRSGTTERRAPSLFE